MDKTLGKPQNLLKELFKVYKIQRFIFIGIILVTVAAIVTPLLEKQAYHSTIKTFGNSLWWALVTVTSTGYGDYYPVTLGGRIIGIILMFSGITLFSTIVALVASYYAHRRIKRDWLRVHQSLDAMCEQLTQLEKKIDYMVKKETK